MSNPDSSFESSLNGDADESIIKPVKKKHIIVSDSEDEENFDNSTNNINASFNEQSRSSIEDKSSAEEYESQNESFNQADRDAEQNKSTAASVNEYLNNTNQKSSVTEEDHNTEEDGSTDASFNESLNPTNQDKSIVEEDHDAEEDGSTDASFNESSNPTNQDKSIVEEDHDAEEDGSTDASFNEYLNNTNQESSVAEEDHDTEEDGSTDASFNESSNPTNQDKSIVEEDHDAEEDGSTDASFNESSNPTNQDKSIVEEDHDAEEDGSTDASFNESLNPTNQDKSIVEEVRSTKLNESADASFNVSTKNVSVRTDHHFADDGGNKSITEADASNIDEEVDLETIQHANKSAHRMKSFVINSETEDLNGSGAIEEFYSESDDEADQSNVVINETVNGSDVILIDSDSEDEVDKQIERECVSPRSRMSMTGIRPADIDSDDSDYSVEDVSTEIVEISSSSQPKITNFTSTFSQKEHDAYIARKSELVEKVQQLQKLLALKHKLPDNGVNIVKKIEETQSEIDKISSKLRNSKVEEQPIPNPPQKESQNISWAEIEMAANAVKPVFLGEQGMATFNKQKTLTMDRLEDLHSSLATCPPESTRVEPPAALKVTLMDHQIYGLAWMMWREQRKPRGGILADDMGLGKTLSMIALIIKQHEIEGDKEESGSSAEESEDEENHWKKKGRKDYYNGGTLVVCPASLINQWNDEITKHVRRNHLSSSVHHGPKRENKSRNLAKFDVVITTYAIATQEHKNDGTIFGIKWNRLILDEAHVTRNYKSKMSEAVCALKAKNRWALTGTPVQNKEMDVYALLKFLKCSPFNDLAIYKKWIESKSSGGQSRLNTIMQSILLRRTKQQLQEKGALNSLPQKTIEVVEIELDKMEMNVYQKIMMFSKTIFSEYLQQKQERENNYYNPIFKKASDLQEAYSKMHQRVLKIHGSTEDGKINSSTILTLLLRLRQICCHPGLIQAMLDQEDNGEVSMDGLEELNLLDHMNRLKVSDDVDEDNEEVAKASEKVLLPSNPVFNLERQSSKIVKIMEFVQAKIQYTNDKAIIVSQWTSFLKLLAQNLDGLRIPYNQLNGNVPVNKRNELVMEINKVGSGPKVMLLSLTAGGVGLNLVGANYLLLTDLHWNPQLEAQAQDRIYRVGQNKPVFIYKFLCTDTIEQRIKALQDKKLEIASSVLTGAKISGSKLSMDDLRSLFDL